MNNKIEEIIRDEEAVWEQRKLSEFVDKAVDNRGKTPPLDENGTHPLIEVAALGGVHPNYSKVDKYLSDDSFENNLRAYIKKGDILFTTVGSIGLVSLMDSREEAAIAQNIVAFRAKENFIPEYLYALFSNEENQYKANRIVMGAVQPSIKVSQLVDVEYMLTRNVKEQKKIGSFFSNIDNLITLHQRISLYFLKINTFVWEQRKLIDFVDVLDGDRGKNYPTSDDFDISGHTLFLNASNVTNDGFLFQDNQFITEEKSNSMGNGKLEEDDIVVTSRGSLGHIAWYNADISSFVPYARINSGMLILRNKKEVETEYLYHFMKSSKGQSQISFISFGSAQPQLTKKGVEDLEVILPIKRDEQVQLGHYFSNLDHLITLHQRKPYFWNKFIVIDWEQRKLGDILISLQNNTLSRADLSNEAGVAKNVHYGDVLIKFGEVLDVSKEKLPMISDESVLSKYKSSFLQNGDVIVADTAEDSTVGKCSEIAGLNDEVVLSGLHTIPYRPIEKFASGYLGYYLNSSAYHNQLIPLMQGIKVASISKSAMQDTDIVYPKSVKEQGKIGDYFQSLDHLITLHHHKLFIINELKVFTVMQCKCHLLLNISNKNKKTKKEIKLMPELERVIEEKLIDQLVYGDSQWTYREDLKTEEDLWRNFKYILEQNNKDRLNGESLSDAEFEQVKNQLQFSSFYKAGEWLVGENGKVMVHVQRDTEKLHLVVMNHEHIAGGSSVYEVINQYSALKDEDDYYTVSRNRRFDVTLMINGLPMIHIELKNRQHSYMDGFNQIKKYISEGKFTGIFSAVQMFVVSNGVDTKYFAAASDTDLNAKFMSGWVDEKNNPVSDYLDFAKSVLRIPEAHEMIARYTVLDRDAKRLIILRPYQIHAIESIREASKIGKSGFVWHTTGSGKTLTSYKATRNLLMDIPSLDKTIFLIDRKDLDTQTSSAFQAYANNDVIAVDKTDNVNDLKKKLKSGDRKVIVTTIQKMQILVTKRLQEDTPEYNKIKNLRIAFVVDECHRAVTPKTKRELERFFGRSLWFGFTGTPRFAENPYAQMGDLPRTTEELYGKCLHKYTIQNAIKDNAVLGFQVEHNGPKNMEDETDPSLYDNETHMLRVLDIILNKSYQKFGLQNGKGQTYEAILTTSSIQLAQKYYELLSKVKNGETDLEIDERMKQVLPDYPKFAITYSVTENEEGSHVNQEKMQKSLNDLH